MIHGSSASLCPPALVIIGLFDYSHPRRYEGVSHHGFYLHFPNDYSRRRQWQPTPVLLPGKSHGQRSLVGCSPWGLEESVSDSAFTFHFSCIGEGNGNPLQCFCLENPRDGGAWWAVGYGVSQSQT